MNRVYNVIWNMSRQVWMVVGELTKSRGKSKSTASKRPHGQHLTGVASALALALSAGPLLAEVETTGNVNPTLDPNPSASWDLGGNNLFVGDTGVGSLLIDDGSTVSNNFGYIGRYDGDNGSITVDGSGSSWTNTSILFVGLAGDGSLTINNGGTVSNTLGYIGSSASSSGWVTVDGANSSWINSEELTVGRSGTGSLTISNGGAVSNTFGSIGGNSAGNGSVTVDGANSSWTNSASIYVGEYGTGSLTISNGGTVRNTIGVIGRWSSSNGSVTVDGTDSNWINSADLTVGRAGTGSLDISNGGVVGSNVGYIGYGATGSGSVTVDGMDSSWINSASLYVGNSGSGSLTISNGGEVSNNLGYIGYDDGSSGSVTVDGLDSSWTNRADLIVGGFGTGNLTISNGGSVSNEEGLIGYNAGTGNVTVDGVGSSWDSSLSLFVGFEGIGSLTISNGGVVNVDSGAGIASIGWDPESTGTINIGAAAGATAVAAGTLNAGVVSFGAGTSSLVFNHTDSAYTFAPNITGTGAISLLSGTTRFTGNGGVLSGYTGTMTIDGGTLSVADGETLSLGGNYTQTSTGTLRIGVRDDTTYGKLLVGGTATLPSNAKIDVNVADANFNFTAASLVSVISAGTLTSDGTFAVTDNSALFDFSAAKNGNNVALILAAAASNDNDNSSGNSSSGVLNAVTSTGNFPATGAAVAFDGIIDVFIANGSSGNTDMDTVINALGRFSTYQQVSDAVAETLPLLVSGTTQITTGTLRSTNRVIQARQSGFSGMSSGDGFFTDKHLWVKPVGSWTTQDERNGVAGYRADSYGLVGGIDSELGTHTRLGFALSYMNSDVDGRGSASGNKVDIDAYQAIFYGSRSLQNHPDIEVNWQADIGINKNQGRRHISFMNRTAKADYDSYTAHIGIGAGKRFELNDTTTIIPSLRADYAYIKDESYTETGAGALNLDIGSNHVDELIVMAQGHLSHQLNDSTSLTANAGLGYDFINDTASLTASYTGGGVAFTTKGFDPNPWLARAGVGVNYQLSDSSEITASYDLEGREDFLNQTASVKFRWMF